MTFWQLVVVTSPDASDGLTNFLWEQGALGVVEEESPGEPPRLPWATAAHQLARPSPGHSPLTTWRQQAIAPTETSPRY